LIGRKSQLSNKNNILYKSIMKYESMELQLWGTTINSNVKIIEKYQSKILRILVNALWFIINNTLHQNLGITTIKD